MQALNYLMKGWERERHFQSFQSNKKKWKIFHLINNQSKG